MAARDILDPSSRGSDAGLMTNLMGCYKVLVDSTWEPSMETWVHWALLVASGHCIGTRDGRCRGVLPGWVPIIKPLHPGDHEHSFLGLRRLLCLSYHCGHSVDHFRRASRPQPLCAQWMSWSVLQPLHCH